MDDAKLSGSVVALSARKSDRAPRHPAVKLVDVRSLIVECEAAADRQEFWVDFHWKAYESAQRTLKDLAEALRRIKEERDKRRKSVELRWRQRQAINEAKKWLAAARPLPMPAGTRAVRTFTRGKVLAMEKMWRAAAAEWPTAARGSGVYALFSGEELVYIGQAESVALRVAQHAQQKEFTAVSFLPVPRHCLDHVERLLLNAFLPRLNRDSTTLSMRRRLREQAPSTTEI